ncbi:protein unc-79 homolog [Antrostomus carolinensis]|uniref:protein unc-79 homolog n=1 Tax=Antrostomus carolinensis TaxID=279965 RepID=UPI00052896BF|nr:protein unc-79 homolog [Antrostomus carolinensis]
MRMSWEGVKSHNESQFTKNSSNTLRMRKETDQSRRAKRRWSKQESLATPQLFGRLYEQQTPALGFLPLMKQVASKIRYLQEYHNRVLHNIYPVPSGTDIANTLKYFSQTLLSILSRTGKKENQDASNLTVPMTMCLFPVPFPLTPSLRPQVSSINPTVTRSLLYSVLRDAPSERGQQSRDAQLSDYPSLDYQGLYVTLVTLLDLVPLLQHGQHGKLALETFQYA